MDDNQTVNERASQIEGDAVREAYKQKSADQTGFVGLPFGKRVPARSFLSQKYRHKDAGEFLYHPEKLLKHPEPGMHYAWPTLSDEDTLSEVRQGRYIYVKLEELKQDAEGQIRTHKGPSGDASDARVCWRQHVLVKVPPEVWEQKFVAPQMRGVANLARSTAAFEDLENQTGGLATGTVERTTN